MTFAWLLFCLTCVYLAFLKPYFVIVPGDRTNVAAGVLCAVALLVTVTVARREDVRGSATEIRISVVLAILALLSAFFSASRADSLNRSFVLLATGFGGFWTARLLLGEAVRVKYFAWLCSILMAGMIALGVWGYLVTGRVESYLYSNIHPVVHVMILLAFGPLYLISVRRAVSLLIGAAILAAAYGALYLAATAGSRIALILPLALLAVPAVAFSFRSRIAPFTLSLILIVSAALGYYAVHVSHQKLLEYQEYRVESYPFSLRIALERPLLGIGLREDRGRFLEGYETRYPGYSVKHFAAELSYLVTSENIFLTFLAGLGVPFFVLYVFALAVLLVRLARSLIRPLRDYAFHPLILAIPLTGSLLHSLSTDTLLIPQINWFFHALLGLIPLRFATEPVTDMRWIGALWRLVAVIVCVAVGVLIGTHPAISPDALVHLGLVRPTEKTAEPEGAPAGEVVKKPRVDSGGLREKTGPAPGILRISVEGYEPRPNRWALMIVLDNSESMGGSAGESSLEPSAAALEFITSVAGTIPEGSRVGLRYFAHAGDLRISGRSYPVRVSRRLSAHRETGGDLLSRLGRTLRFSGLNNVCAAVGSVIRRDFADIEARAPRVLVLTDAASACRVGLVRAAGAGAEGPGSVPTDTALFGSSPLYEADFANLAEATGGILLRVRSREDLAGAQETYAAVLTKPQPARIAITGPEGTMRAQPGEDLEVSPGRYQVGLSGFPPSEADDGIKVESGRISSVRIVVGPSGIIIDEDK